MSTVIKHYHPRLCLTPFSHEDNIRSTPKQLKLPFVYTWSLYDLCGCGALELEYERKQEEICWSPHAFSDSLMWHQDFLGNKSPSGIALRLQGCVRMCLECEGVHRAASHFYLHGVSAALSIILPLSSYRLTLSKEGRSVKINVSMASYIMWMIFHANNIFPYFCLIIQWHSDYLHGLSGLFKQGSIAHEINSKLLSLQQAVMH